MFLLILYLPLFSSVCAGFFGFKLGTKGVALTTLISLVGSFLSTVYVFGTLGLSLTPGYLSLAQWVVMADLVIQWEFYIDNLSLCMCLLVTIVSSLVYLYSLVYMGEDPHIIRFSCYITLFTFFMLILLSSGNFLQLFFGWEGVGVASYLLINFWFTRVQANKAAVQALMVNKVGDIALLIAMAVHFWLYNSLDFSIIYSVVPYQVAEVLMLIGLPVSSVTLSVFFLFIGAMGKSAQLGLHTWLPSAMEGPTPVSALIHAATMVTAGIFLILRCSLLFEYSSSILMFGTCIGALTAFFASTAGLVQNDLKRVIAYSTCSQLGYMVFACGLSNYGAALFHLINHGFFKALLFLSAGSVIHGLSDEQDLRRLGGLGKLFPVTYCMFLIGSLSLMGFPFLSGFFSKDIILEGAFAQYTIMGLFAYWLGTLSAFFTACYSVRLIYVTFGGWVQAPKALIQRAQEASGLMLVSLLVLSVGSIFSGFLFKEVFVGMGSTFFGSALSVLPIHYTGIDAEFLPTAIKLIPVVCSLLGAWTVYLVYQQYSWLLFYIKRSPQGRLFYTFFNQKWLFEFFLNQSVLKPLFHWSYKVPFRVLDKGLIEWIGPAGLFYFITRIAKRVSSVQSGLIYHYTCIFVVGVMCYLHLVVFFQWGCSFFSVEIWVYYMLLSISTFLL